MQLKRENIYVFYFLEHFQAQKAILNIINKNIV